MATHSTKTSHSATPSVASAASSVGSTFFLPQYMKVPDPSYISLDAANAIVSSYPPPEPTRDLISKDIIVTTAGLRTVNLFLDYILHEFLARAKSTSLLRLRNAVALVVRTTLGTAAMVEAEQELAAYLHDSDTELYVNGDESDDDADVGSTGWNLEKVWARARTKCMIYSTLGDKEEDDFEEESEEEDYDIPASRRKLSPAGAIYLTAVLEFIGEHCFLVSARTAYHRIDNSLRGNETREPVQLTIEDADVKRGIAEDDLTTRIWRRWKRSEKLFTTMTTLSTNHLPEKQHAVDSSPSETFNHLPFTSAQTAIDLGPVNIKRDSVVSAPDLSRTESVESCDSRSKSLPPLSPTKSSKKQIRRRSKGSSDSTARQIDSTVNIKEALGERGITFPDSPHYSEQSTSGALPTERRSSNVSSDDSRRGSLHVEDVEDQASDGDDEAAAQDEVTIPREDAPEPTPLDDPLKTPTPRDFAKIPNESSQTAMDEDEDAVIIGGAGGVDFSIWETKPVPNERFFVIKPVPVPSSPSTEVLYPANETPKPVTEDVTSTLTTKPVSQALIPSASEDISSEVETPHTNVTPAAGPAVIIKASPITTEVNTIPGSWPKDDSVDQRLTPEPNESDAASNHVNDRIAEHFAELEQQTAAISMLGDITMNGMSQVTVTNIQRGPIIVNHTELTPILESNSARESMVLDDEPQIAPRLMSLKSHSSEERVSRPHTGHSHSSSKDRSSPAVSTHSNDRARSTSLTSQAERLRNKFMNRKAPPETDLTLDAVTVTKSERRMKYESLIRSGETMKMSLTPTSLRFLEDDMDGEPLQHRTIPAKVRKQARENSTRELAEFLRSTGPESFLGSSTNDRRGSLPANQWQDTKSPPQTVRNVPSTPIMKNQNRVYTPPLPRSSKFIPRSPVGNDPDHNTLQLAAFLRATGPDEGSSLTQSIREKDSIHSNGDSSTTGLLKHQSQRYPPSPSTSTAYGVQLEDEDSDDPELSLYPGARRKRKNMQQEESLVDFLRNTGPLEPTLPPSPTTPKMLRDNFGVTTKGSRANMKSPEPGQSRGVDIFEAVRAMSPTPSAHTVGTSKPTHFEEALPPPVPIKPLYVSGDAFGSSSSLVANGEYFNEKNQSRSTLTRQNSTFRQVDLRNDQDEAQSSTSAPRTGNTPRDAVLHSSNTDSLAEFLRSTGPADFGEPAPKPVKKSKSGFFKRMLGTNDKGAKIQRNESQSGRFTPITIPALINS